MLTIEELKTIGTEFTFPNSTEFNKISTSRSSTLDREWELSPVNMLTNCSYFIVDSFYIHPIYGECVCFDIDKNNKINYWIVPISEFKRLNLIKNTKKIEDLSYPDVVCITNENEHKILNFYHGISGYNKNYSCYLIGAQGYAEDKSSYEGQEAIEGKIYSVYDFKDLIIPFYLPEKWCVKVTDENKYILDEWRKKQPDIRFESPLYHWLLSSKYYDKSYCSHSVDIPNNYTEISFEDFEKHVYSSKTMSDKVCVRKNDAYIEYFNQYLKKYKDKYPSYVSTWQVFNYKMSEYFYSSEISRAHSGSIIPEGFTEISFEEFKLRFPLKEPTPIKSSIPKYVRLTRDSIWKVPKGEICEVIEENPAAYTQWILKEAITKCDMISEGGNKFYMKKRDCVKATEEEYLAQFKPKEMEQLTKDGTPFVKGKWYKDVISNPLIYIKYVCPKSSLFFEDSERIKGTIYSTEKDYMGWTINGRSWMEVKDLSEIQPYLPEGHPDKQSNEIKVTFSLGKSNDWVGVDSAGVDSVGLFKKNDFIFNYPLSGTIITSNSNIGSTTVELAKSFTPSPQKLEIYVSPKLGKSSLKPKRADLFLKSNYSLKLN